MDPVVARWVAGWSAVRDIAVDSLDGWPLLRVDGPSRRTELVCVEPGVDVLPSLAAHVAGDPGAMLTVVTADRAAYVAAGAPVGTRVDRDDETLMVADLSAAASETDLDEALVVAPHATRYELGDGERLVSWATVGVLDGWATFDRVETIPSHRRRGLGRHTMARLTTLAVEQGAAHGVLAASADGRGLYEALGWRRHLDLWSLMGV